MAHHESAIEQLTAGVKDLLNSKDIMGLVTIFGLIFAAAVVTGLHGMYVGYHHVYGVTREIPWGLLISTYVFFAVTSTGLCLVSAIGHVFGIQDFMPIAKRAVFLSIVTLLAGFLVIGFDIENPHRMALYNVLSPNITSNIWWMGTLYSVCLLFMVVEFIFLLAGIHKWAVFSGLMAVIFEVAANSTLGGVFGMIPGREYWNGPFMSIFFVTSAMLTGCATIIFFTWWASRLKTEDMKQDMKRSMEVVAKLGTLLIFVVVFFTIWKVFTNVVASPAKREAIMAFLSGPYSLNFWGFEILLALLLPLVFFLISRGRDFNLIFLASALMLVGIFVMRYDMVLYGQIVPVFYDLGVEEYSTLLKYTPSFHEIVIAIGGISFTVMSFLAGEKIFQGHKVESH